MDEFILGSVLLIHLLAVMSPGPDFVLVVRNAVGGSKEEGIASAFGIAIGNIVHMSYCLAGIGLLIAHSPRLFATMQYLGAAYLAYLGIKSFIAKEMDPDQGLASPADKSLWAALRSGFWVCLFNPKATLYFLMFFSVIVDVSALPIQMEVLLLVLMVSIALGWFMLVSVFFSQARIREAFFRCQGIYNKLFGVLLLALALKVALLH